VVRRVEHHAGGGPSVGPRRLVGGALVRAWRGGVGQVEFREVVRRRRMVRNYDPLRPVPADVVTRMLEHAIRAPSAGFSQGWSFLILESQPDRDRFWGSAAPRTGVRPRWLEGMRNAPLIIVPHSNKNIYLERYAAPDKGWTDRDEARWPVPYWDVDAGFASLLMLLTAVDEGLGACFFGIPPRQIPDYRVEFGVPQEFNPIGAISVGYPAPDRPSSSLKRGRRPVSEVVHRGQWSA
jgi:nitroreductase